jgi:Ser/Thr protein kinase RdoA (MazF antagonist)
MSRRQSADLAPLPGPAPTDLFFALTPERVLAAVEAAGLRCTGLCYPLNSFENRVYDIELDDRSRVVAKFYRPGRWRAEQILEEHELIAELDAAEIPVCTVRPFPDGTTLRQIEGIYYTLADRRGGRAPDELDDRLTARLGMLVARLHNVGATHPAQHRWTIDADRFVREPLAFLRQRTMLAPRLELRYEAAALGVAAIADRELAGVPVQRVHGDLHRGNLLLRDGLLWLLDFDDMAMAPAVQDIWLVLPGRDRESLRQREVFLDAYEQLRAFDRRHLRLVEPLRGLRMVHYAGWLARRAHDPAFQRAWPDFGSEDWWERETADLEAQLRVMRGEAEPEEEVVTRGHAALEEDPSALTNKDYFFDWEEPKG